MSPHTLKAKFYLTPTGRQPVRKWLLSLSAKERAIIQNDIKATQIGWPIGLPLCRSLGGGLYEIRSSLPNRIARVIFLIKGETVWLLHGFIKKQQKTPKQELDLARQRAHAVLQYYRKDR